MGGELRATAATCVLDPLCMTGLAVGAHGIDCCCPRNRSLTPTPTHPTQPPAHTHAPPLQALGIHPQVEIIMERAEDSVSGIGHAICRQVAELPGEVVVVVGSHTRGGRGRWAFVSGGGGGRGGGAGCFCLDAGPQRHALGHCGARGCSAWAGSCPSMLCRRAGLSSVACA